MGRIVSETKDLNHNMTITVPPLTSRGIRGENGSDHMANSSNELKYISAILAIHVMENLPPSLVLLLVSIFHAVAFRRVNIQLYHSREGIRRPPHSHVLRAKSHGRRRLCDFD